MGHVIALLLKVDAAVQRRFDSVCFFLMRRFGIRKSAMRYFLHALSAGGFAGLMTARRIYGLASLSDALIGGGFVILLILLQHMDATFDREAEARPGVGSKADWSSGGGLMKPIGAIAIFLESLRFRYVPSEYLEAGLTDGQHVFPTICTLIFMTAFVARAYLRKTPMNPPAAKEKEPVLTPQPAPAKL